VAVDWDTFVGRLRWAISQQRPEGRQRGLRLFQRKMDQCEGVPGTSLSAIQSYLRGVEPTRPFIVEAARVLHVRAPWLAFADGQPTEAAEAAWRAARDDRALDVEAVEGFNKHLPWDFVGPAGKAQLWKLWGFMANELAGPEHDGLTAEEAASWATRTAAERAARAVAAPTAAAGFALPPLGSGALESYVVSVCEGLFALLAEAYREDLEG
jgi:hypothetical protein